MKEVHPAHTEKCIIPPHEGLYFLSASTLSRKENSGSTILSRSKFGVKRPKYKKTPTRKKTNEFFANQRPRKQVHSLAALVVFLGCVI